MADELDGLLARLDDAALRADLRTTSTACAPSAASGWSSSRASIRNGENGRRVNRPRSRRQAPLLSHDSSPSATATSTATQRSSTTIGTATTTGTTATPISQP